MPLAFEQVALVDLDIVIAAAVGQDKQALAMLLVILELAFVEAAVGPGIDTSPLHITFKPIAIVALAVDCAARVPLQHAPLERAQRRVAREDPIVERDEAAQEEEEEDQVDQLARRLTDRVLGERGVAAIHRKPIADGARVAGLARPPLAASKVSHVARATPEEA